MKACVLRVCTHVCEYKLVSALVCTGAITSYHRPCLTNTRNSFLQVRRQEVHDHSASLGRRGPLLIALSDLHCVLTYRKVLGVSVGSLSQEC